MEPRSGDEKPHLPPPTLWPAGFAVGVAVALVGLVVSWVGVAIGAGIAVVFGYLWVRDVLAGHPHLAEMPEAAPAPAAPAAVEEEEEDSAERFPRSIFLEGATLGLGGLIGGAVTVPVVGAMVVPPFLHQGHKEIDVGPLNQYPQGQWRTVHFSLSPKDGDVARRTAYVRSNGLLNGIPSFTIISNRCAHLGCPVQANGLTLTDQTKDEETPQKTVVQLTPVEGLSGFSCPCHGGAYDKEGNRTAGPPVRGLDRYEFSIKNGRLFLGRAFSVNYVRGEGAQARIKKYELTGPGQHVAGVEGWLYPIQPPH